MKKVDDRERVLIVSDLDSTLLNNKGELDPLTIKVVKRLTAMGHIFCLVTGRPPVSSLPIYNKLGLKSLVVNYNGAYIYNPNNKLYPALNLGFNFAIIKKILTTPKIVSHLCNYVIETNNGAFFKRIPTDKSAKNLLYSSFHVHDVTSIKKVNRDFSNVEDYDVHSVLLQTKDSEQIDDILYELRRFSKTLITRIWQDYSFGYIFEINSVFASKGNALKYLSSYYSIDKAHTVAFGDGDNDAQMLAAANNGVAMKNGTTTAKLSASFITKYSNDDQGVARELIRLFKLKGFEND